MKKAIVVGATSGIGQGLAQYLVDQGYKVGITGRRTYLLVDLQHQNAEKYTIEHFDVTDIQNVSEHLNTLTNALGGLDLMIISAGTGDLNESLDFAIEKRAIDTNVSGFTAIADWAFKYFEQQKFGQLVAITSIAGLRGNRHSPSYSASKAYQINYLEGLRQKATKIKSPIIVTDIRLGYVNTAMVKGTGEGKKQGLFWIASVKKQSAKSIERYPQKGR